MKRKQLKELLDSGTVLPFYVFLGDDWYMKKIYIERIANLTKGTTEYININEEEELNSLLKTVSQPTMFSKGNKVVVLRINLNKPKIKHVLPAPGTVVILDVNNISGDPGESHIVEFDKPSLQELETFISYRIKNSNPKKHMLPSLKRQIAMQFSNHPTYTLNLFMDKLILYTGDKAVITEEDALACGLAEETPDNSHTITSLRSEKEIANFVNKIRLSREPHILIQELSAPYLKIYINMLSKTCDENFSTVNKLEMKRVENIILMLATLDEEIKSGMGESFWPLLKAKLTELTLKG